MGGFLVRSRRGGRPIDLDEHEAGGIVGLLDNIEAGDAGFAHAVTGILEARGLEGLDALGFYVDVDMDDEHGERMCS
jgi:hypothetical protein